MSHPHLMLVIVNGVVGVCAIMKGIEEVQKQRGKLADALMWLLIGGLLFVNIVRLTGN